MSSFTRENTIVLFDVDGTLTPARKHITPNVLEALKALRGKVTIGFVGGSDLSKQKEQIGENVLEIFDYGFAENGLMAFHNGEEIARKSIADYIPNNKFKEFINFILLYLATEVDCPVKRGTFIEYRTGMINVSPVGRNCSQKEREEFEKYDLEHKVRPKMVEVLKTKFADLNFTYSIGGQISFDVFPTGWDKTYCLQFLDKFTNVYFFGDKTAKGGNDYEIYESPRTIGQTVTSPEDTLSHLKKIFMI